MACSTLLFMCWGRLWRAAGRGRTVTCQPRRAAICRMWPARAPQTTISIGDPREGGYFSTSGCAGISTIRWSGAGSEAELDDEAVVEVLAVAEFDILHLLQEGWGGDTIADGEEGHLSAFACYVAGRDNAAVTDVGDQADSYGG